MIHDGESGNGWGNLPALIATFVLVSVLSFGGGNATLPLIKQLTISQQHWLNAQQFVHVYALGRLAPGPISLYMVIIGYRAGSWIGGLVVLLAVYLPASIMMYVVSSIWHRFSGTDWEESIRRGLAPVTVGLILAGTYEVGTTAITGPVTAGIALATVGLLVWRRVNPALVVLGSAVIGAIFLR